jgi:ornithine decarboxylase
VFCEPGRALVAEACSLVVKVEFRRGHRLYLNDGAYGSLADMKLFRTVYPVRLLRPGGAGGRLASFALFGPTCDSYDSLPGTSPLPEDVREGDWIEFGQIGAYSNVLQTRFNGFEARRFVQVEDGALRPAAARAA